MRGNRSPPRPQVASSARASLNPAPEVAPVTDRLYQPTRVLMSVLFTPHAATSISTSSPATEGTGTSSRNSSISGPPVPTSTAARMVAGGCHPGGWVRWPLGVSPTAPSSSSTAAGMVTPGGVTCAARDSRDRRSAGSTIEVAAPPRRRGRAGPRPRPRPLPRESSPLCPA